MRERIDERGVEEIERRQIQKNVGGEQWELIFRF